MSKTSLNPTQLISRKRERIRTARNPSRVEEGPLRTNPVNRDARRVSSKIKVLLPSPNNKLWTNTLKSKRSVKVKLRKNNCNKIKVLLPSPLNKLWTNTLQSKRSVKVKLRKNNRNLMLCRTAAPLKILRNKRKVKTRNSRGRRLLNNNLNPDSSSLKIIRAE
jgi:hypothetical protein